jgi:hypothetical protein
MFVGVLHIPDNNRVSSEQTKHIHSVWVKGSYRVVICDSLLNNQSVGAIS